MTHFKEQVTKPTLIMDNAAVPVTSVVTQTQQHINKRPQCNKTTVDIDNVFQTPVASHKKDARTKHEQTSTTNSMFDAFQTPFSSTSSPSIKSSKFLEVNLAKDFLALKSRSCSSSTPYLAKTTKCSEHQNIRSEDESINYGLFSPQASKESSQQLCALDEQRATKSYAYMDDSWTHIRLKGRKGHVMDKPKSSLPSDHSTLNSSSSTVLPKRYSLANFTVSSGDSGFHDLSTTVNSTLDNSHHQKGSKAHCAQILLQTESFDNVMSKFTPAVPDRLIGRKMGLDFVDVVGELQYLNLYPCLSTILGYLSANDLHSFCGVSKRWKSICRSDSKANKRYTLQIATLSEKENPGCSKTKTKKMTRVRDLSFSSGVLTIVQQSGQVTPPAVTETTNQTPYAEEIAKLRRGESMRKCPRCQSASKVRKAEERAICLKKTCQFDYCILCLSDFHGSKPCSLAIGKRTAVEKVGTKKSKRNLKRL